MTQIKVIATDRPVLHQGSEGAWIIYLQNALNGCGYEPLKLDGDFGQNTTKVVKIFQKDMGLDVDGVVGENTWEALDKHKKLPNYEPIFPRTGIAGADTREKVNSDMIARAQQLMGARPQFWGRYFLGRDAEYIHQEENNALFSTGTRILPICRETRRVNGSQADGNDVGRRVAADVLETFGEDYLASQGGIFYIFLDTEPRPEPALSSNYYLGWSKAVMSASSRVKFLPCVYLNAGDEETATALLNAMNSGAECHGLWIANYGKRPDPVIRPWFEKQANPTRELPCPVLIHQYVGDIDNTGVYNIRDGVYDFNQINPFLDEPESLVLERFIFPQQM